MDTARGLSLVVMRQAERPVADAAGAAAGAG
jgi:hypothetical protein